ncbi:MAG TPA: oligosaccharide flippase family protein [Pirellulales bacterium]|nr:oligosaccharide flippase family protein [Pirellulales bacterium]
MNTKSISEKARSALLWNGGFSVVRDVVHFGVTLVLVRLLTTEDYGAYAVVMSVFAFLSAFSFENFMAHVLQVRDDREVHWQDHFTAAVVVQLAIFLVTNLVALGMRYTHDYARVAGAVHVVSCVALLACMGGFRMKVLERAHDWRRLRSLHLAGVVAGNALAIGLAAAGAGVYALVIGPFLKYVPFLIDLFLVERWRPTFRWNASNWAAAWWFGLNRISAQAVQRSRKLVESGIMVHLVGLAALGVYGRAVGLAQLACLQLTSVAMQSIYPVLTRIKPGSAEYARACHLALRGAAWFVVPVGVALATLSGPLVRLLYGSRWTEVIPILPWAMAVGAVAGLGQVLYNLVLGNLQHRACLMYDIWTLVGTVLALGTLFATNESSTYLGALAVVEAVGAVGLLWQLRCTSAVQLSDVTAAILYAGVAATLALFAGKSLVAVTGLDIEAITGAALFAAAFAATYLVCLRLLFARSLRELLGQLPAGRHLGRLLRLTA